jgi:tRNA(Leu) C34 or U34 (ribose-2'-O)-methylase TrmL
MYDTDQHGLDPAAFVEAMDPRGRTAKVTPVTPAVVLCDPKYPHNLGQVVRACSCFDVKQIWWSGQRVLKQLEGLSRLPREERMRGYAEVQILHHDRPLDVFAADAVPVAIEFRPGSESLPDFEHPEKAVYVFGPEDGSVPPGVLRECHRFVCIPSKHCLNLSMAVGMVLYDRIAKAVSFAAVASSTG